MAVAAVLVTLAAWLIARLTTRPIRELTAASKRISSGELGQKMTVAARDEMGELASAFNEMSARLKELVAEISEDRARLATILDNMADGVIMTDDEGNITLANKGTQELFDFRERVGQPLIEACIEGGYRVVAIPGPTALATSLVISGLPTDSFLFQGFLPRTAAARRRALTEVADQPRTLVLFEAARRLPAALAELAQALGPREAAVARELTKRFEEVRRGPLDRLAADYARAGAPKGEVVLVIGPPAANGLISNYGWRVSYLILGIIVLTVIVLSAQLLKGDPSQVGQVADGGKRSVKKT